MLKHILFAVPAFCAKSSTAPTHAKPEAIALGWWWGGEQFPLQASLGEALGWWGLITTRFYKIIIITIIRFDLFFRVRISVVASAGEALVDNLSSLQRTPRVHDPQYIST